MISVNACQDRVCYFLRLQDMACRAWVCVSSIKQVPPADTFLIAGLQHSRFECFASPAEDACCLNEFAFVSFPSAAYGYGSDKLRARVGVCVHVVHDLLS